MARLLVVGIYMADLANTMDHLSIELAASRSHYVEQRWAALTLSGKGRCDLPMTQIIVTDPTPKFRLLNKLIDNADEFDWVFLCDDDVEVEPGFLDSIISISQKYDFALFQPARTVDSLTDHPIVQVMPGLVARRTRFVEIGPLVCIRRDAVRHLLPFGDDCGMGWGLDFVWPVRLERAGLRIGIIDAVTVAHRIRPPVATYRHSSASRDMFWVVAGEEHLSLDEAFTIVEAYA